MNKDPAALRHDRFVSDELAFKDLGSDAFSKWDACRNLQHFMGFRYKVLVLYKVMFGLPSIQDVLTCVSLDVSLDSGLTSTWTKLSGEHITISYTPAEVGVSCFLWHPTNSNVDYLEYKGKFNARFSLGSRTPLHYRDERDGCVYMAEKAVFDKIHPGVLT